MRKQILPRQCRWTIKSLLHCQDDMIQVFTHHHLLLHPLFAIVPSQSLPIYLPISLQHKTPTSTFPPLPIAPTFNKQIFSYSTLYNQQLPFQSKIVKDHQNKRETRVKYDTSILFLLEGYWGVVFLGRLQYFLLDTWPD